MDSPAVEMNDELLIYPLENGKIKVEFVVKGRSVGDFEVDSAKTTTIVAQMLAAARMAQEKSNSPVAQPVNSPALQPSKIGLGSCDIPDHEALMVQFGNTALGIALPRSVLQGLGQALQELNVKARKY